jgi:hypothetical protein
MVALNQKTKTFRSNQMQNLLKAFHVLWPSTEKIYQCENLKLNEAIPVSHTKKYSSTDGQCCLLRSWCPPIIVDTEAIAQKLWNNYILALKHQNQLLNSDLLRNMKDIY